MSTAVTVTNAITALIAEDEALLAQALKRELKALWPELQTQIATDGSQAVEMALAELPRILFFDVRMPGQSGLEAAQEITERWPPDQRLPLLVLITAFDEYAVRAFEHAAVDYIVKPVKTARLQLTLDRIKHQIHGLAGIEHMQSATQLIAHADPDESQLSALRTLLRSPPDTAQHQPLLQHIQASVGSQIIIVPIGEVAYFEAADKYVRVLAGVREPQRELLIRTPIKDLIPRLDPHEFWQIHRSTLVRASLIEAVQRDEASRLSISLRGRIEKLAVSRLYTSLFKAM